MAGSPAVLYSRTMLSVKVQGRKPGEAPVVAVVGIRVLKKASARNLLKRRLRALAREFGILAALPPGRKCVIIARPESARASFAELKACIRKIAAGA